MKLVGRGEECGGVDGLSRTLVVGVKLDQPSKELLTWALVKLAHPGDHVVALHVLDPDEVVDREGQSSLLSLVKAFDTVLAVYEGFCNLKQVDLKLKVCRGSSVKKVLVQEAKAVAASKVIVGVPKTKTRRSIGLSVTVAKYCSRKLPRECCVLAVNNGKVVFRREGIPSTAGKFNGDQHTASKLLGGLHRSLSKNSRSSNIKLLEYPAANINGRKDDYQEIQDKALLVSDSGNNSSEDVRIKKPPKKKCSICSRFSVLLPEEALCHDSPEPHSPSCDEASAEVTTSSENALALVPVQAPEAANSTISSLGKDVSEVKPGWPLLRRTFLPDRKSQNKKSSGHISVVQWALRLPSRQHSGAAIHPDHKSPLAAVTRLDGDNGAMILVGDRVSTSVKVITKELKSIPKELESLQTKYSATCRLFNYQELVRATSNFSQGNLIGKGGSSRVYRGHLPDGKELAVKILKPSEDVVQEFVLEIEIITTVTHKNIISLFGFCYEDSNLLLVYDFLTRGSLEENLHGDKERHVLGWNERYKVALGVAEALDYLHSRGDQPVIHRDVKSSNILLSDDFEPQLSDFGLAKWAANSPGHVTYSDVAGTFGYLAPEYFMHGKVTEKIDVYAFGVVLLELLSGRKPISNNHPKGRESLVMWAKPILSSGKHAKLLDPLLEDLVDKDQMEKMVMAASLCIRRAPRFRPRMGTVLKLLQGDIEVMKWAKLQINSSEELDVVDEDSFPASNIQSHLTLALLDVEDDALSVSSTEPNVLYLTASKSLEDYLQGRRSRSSSFD